MRMDGARLGGTQVSSQGPARKSNRAGGAPARRFCEQLPRTVYLDLRPLRPLSSLYLARFVHFIEPKERAMKQDVLAISGGMVALGAVVWMFWGNPVNVTRAPVGEQQLGSDPGLKLVSERSPYMRTER